MALHIVYCKELILKICSPSMASFQFAFSSLMQQCPGFYKSRLPCRKRAGDNFSIKIKRGFKFIVIYMKMRQMMFVVITPIHFYQNSIKHFSGVSASNLRFRRSGCPGFCYRSLPSLTQQSQLVISGDTSLSLSGLARFIYISAFE